MLDGNHKSVIFKEPFKINCNFVVTSLCLDN